MPEAACGAATTFRPERSDKQVRRRRSWVGTQEARPNAQEGTSPERQIKAEAVVLEFNATFASLPEAAPVRAWRPR